MANRALATLHADIEQGAAGAEGCEEHRLAARNTAKVARLIHRKRTMPDRTEPSRMTVDRHIKGRVGKGRVGEHHHGPLPPIKARKAAISRAFAHSTRCRPSSHRSTGLLIGGAGDNGLEARETA